MIPNKPGEHSNLVTVTAAKITDQPARPTSQASPGLGGSLKGSPGGLWAGAEGLCPAAGRGSPKWPN